MPYFRIYTLTDPTDNRLYYVGVSVQPDTLLICRHMANAGNLSTTRKIQRAGKKPILEIIDEAYSLEDAANLEEYWFSQLRSWGYKLDNKVLKNGRFRRYLGDPVQKYRDWLNEYKHYKKAA